MARVRRSERRGRRFESCHSDTFSDILKIQRRLVAHSPCLRCGKQAGNSKELPWNSLTFLAFLYNIVIEGIRILYHNPYILIIYPVNNYVNDW